MIFYFPEIYYHRLKYAITDKNSFDSQQFTKMIKNIYDTIEVSKEHQQILDTIKNKPINLVNCFDSEFIKAKRIRNLNESIYICKNNFTNIVDFQQTFRKFIYKDSLKIIKEASNEDSKVQTLFNKNNIEYFSACELINICYKSIIASSIYKISNRNELIENLLKEKTVRCSVQELYERNIKLHSKLKFKNYKINLDNINKDEEKSIDYTNIRNEVELKYSKCINTIY